MRKVKNLLVTGGCGFMGSAFIRYLLSLPRFEGKIINLDCLNYAASKKNLSSYEEDKRYYFIEGNIKDAPLVTSLLDNYNIDTIVHFAAETHVDKSIISPLLFMDTNVRGTLTLLEEVRKRENIHFHQISSDEVFGTLGKEGVFQKNSPFRPNSPYSASKASADHFVRAYERTYAISTTISHSVNNFGPGQYCEKLLPLMIHNCLEKKALPLYGTGENIRDWLYVEDHAEAIWQILLHGKKGENYLIGAGEEISNKEMIILLIDELARQSGEERKSYLSLIRYVTDRPGHDFRYALDFSTIQKELGWAPRHSLREGLKKTIAWHLSEFAAPLPT